MRVAVVITGLPRNVKEGYDFFWKHIIERYNADVYTFAWKTDDHQLIPVVYSNVMATMGSQFSDPTKLKIGLDDVQAEDSTSNLDEKFGVGGYFRGLPLFFSWQCAASLFMYRTISSQINYDMVVRGRFDLFNPDINLDNIDPSKLNVSAHNWPNSHICDDNLMVTSPENFMQLHINIYNDYVNYAKEHKRIYFQERMLTEMIDYKGMTPLVNKSHDLKFHFIRDVLKSQV